MADIRILDDKFKNIIKQAEKSMDEYHESIKSEQKLLIELSYAKLLKNAGEIDLFLRTMARKLVELGMNIHLLNIYDMELLHRLQYFLEHLKQERNEFYESIRQQFVTMSPQFVQMPNIVFSPFE